MPTSAQYEIVKAQVSSFNNCGFESKLEIQPMMQGAAPKIIIHNWVKSYRFCDPDWDVVSKQLAQLYKTITKENHVKKMQR